ncbi:MAG: class I SAM-dependent methyltransferase [Thermodesulfobacteriota bacterium]|nr:class I SAM-dependent methyltransferase [Thermodesulfobacteriota bacterium]
MKKIDDQQIICPCCRNRHITKALSLSGGNVSSSWGVTTGERVIYRCLSCDVRFADSVFDSQADDQQMYDLDYQNTMSGDSPEKEKQSGLIEQSLERLKLIKPLKPVGKLLDIGCSTGIFLECAAQHQYNVSGLDPSLFACKKACRRLGNHIKIEQSDILQSNVMDREHFDIITLWDVIEHCRDMDNVMKKMVNALGPKGIIVIRTPDIKSIFFQAAVMAYHLSFKKIKYPVLSIFHADHHFFFSKTALIDLFHRHNLKILSIQSDPLLWKRFKYCECRRGAFVNAALIALYWAARCFNKGHGIIITGEKI